MPTLALPHNEYVHAAVLPINLLLRKVWNEYVEMPGLRLTRAQAQRLWAVDEATCIQLLDRLVQAKLLAIGSDGRYGRDPDMTSGLPSAVRMLKIGLPTASRQLVKTG